MSMLAEPRRKANWVLNPKNTNWTANTSKYGLRIMEKMGWTEGKGLGAAEQGSTEQILVKVRSDNRGVGFKDRAEDELVHQSEFSELLEQLASEAPPLGRAGDGTKSAGIVSLEEKSQMSRSRVHYRKFTRGKDLSRYSEKDLASILGKPAPLNSSGNATYKSVLKETSFQSDVSTVNGGNMFEYFRKKESSIGLEERASDANTSEDICANNSWHEVNGTEDAIDKTNVIKKKKKSKKAAKCGEQNTLDAELNAVENTEIISETRKDRKRKQKAFKVLEISGQDIESENNFRIEYGLNSNQFTLGSEDCINKVNDVADGGETKKERKKRRKAEKALKYSEKQTIVEDATNLEIVEKKLDRKCKQTLESAFDNNELNEKKDENALLEEVNVLKGKKRRKFERALEFSQHQTELEITTDSGGNPRKKISNLTLEDGEQAESNDKLVERMEKKEKRKRKKASGDKDNSAKNIEGCDSADLGSGEWKKKKSKKSKKGSDGSVSELEFQESAANFSGLEKKKKKRKPEDDISVDVIPDNGNQKQMGELLKNSAQEGNTEEGIKDAEGIIKENYNKMKINHEEEFDRKYFDSRSAKVSMEQVGEEYRSEGKPFGCNNQQAPAAMAVNEPELFCDARPKKAQKKGKLRKTAEESNDRLAAGSEMPQDTANVLNMNIERTSKEDNGFSVIKKNNKKCKGYGREEPLLSENLEKSTSSVYVGIAGNFETKKESKHKIRNKEPLSIEVDVEMADAVKVDAECLKKKDNNTKRKDRDASDSAEKIEHGILNKNNGLSEEIFCREQIQSEKKNAVDSIGDSVSLRPQEHVENIIDREENMSVGDTLCAGLNGQEEVMENDVNIADDIDTGFNGNAKIEASNHVEEICSTSVITPITVEKENKASSLPEKNVALKKPVSVVELDGKVYINGICNFELSHPVINNVELKRIPPNMRDNVEFLPIPGANVDEFGYIGLPYYKGKSEVA